MNAQRFCDWLQGYIEMGGGPPTYTQWEIMKSHLALVYDKVTPDIKAAPAPVVSTPSPAPWQDKVIETQKKVANPLKEINDQRVNLPYIIPQAAPAIWPPYDPNVFPYQRPLVTC